MYIKLTARKNTWFKEGTEVFWDAPDGKTRRPTEIELEEMKKEDGWNVFYGIRVCENNPNENGMGYRAGEERFDGKACHLEEFDIEAVSNSLVCPF